ncbi:MAG TPA: response regulator transcription factor [Isosphaeraceae bacterium]
MAKIRVLMADDHAMLWAGPRLMINAQPDMEVVGEAANGHEAVTLAGPMAPDVVTLDLTMPGGSSIKMIERLRRECPRCRVLVVTMHDDPAYVRAALAAGSSGYVVKSAPEAELLTAIRAVARGRTFVGPDLAPDLSDPASTRPAGAGPTGPAGPASPFSQREREVLELLAQGHTNQAIGDRLFLCVKTIETYRARIAEKLGLRTRADIIRYAIEIGLLGRDRLPPGDPAP